MSKNRLGWIITLMSVALTGLIAFQWYWIDTVITGNRDHFERDVMTALSNVTKKLEQQEALFYVNRKMSNFSSQGQSRGFQPFQFQATPPLNQRQILQGEKKIRFDDSLSSTGSFNFSFEVVGAPLRSNQMGKAFFDVLKSNINNIQFAYPKDAPGN